MENYQVDFGIAYAQNSSLTNIFEHIGKSKQKEI